MKTMGATNYGGQFPERADDEYIIVRTMNGNTHFLQHPPLGGRADVFPAKWSLEYPDAQLYWTAQAARKDWTLLNDSSARVVKNYGLDTEEAVYSIDNMALDARLLDLARTIWSGAAPDVEPGDWDIEMLVDFLMDSIGDRIVAEWAYSKEYTGLVGQTYMREHNAEVRAMLAREFAGEVDQTRSPRRRLGRSYERV